MRRDSHIAWRLQYGSVSGSNLYNFSPTFRWENEGFIPPNWMLFPQIGGFINGGFCCSIPISEMRCSPHSIRSSCREWSVDPLACRGMVQWKSQRISSTQDVKAPSCRYQAYRTYIYIYSIYIYVCIYIL